MADSDIAPVFSDNRAAKKIPSVSGRDPEGARLHSAPAEWRTVTLRQFSAWMDRLSAEACGAACPRGRRA